MSKCIHQKLDEFGEYLPMVIDDDVSYMQFSERHRVTSVNYNLAEWGMSEKSNGSQRSLRAKKPATIVQNPSVYVKRYQTFFSPYMFAEATMLLT
ncbi:MAG: hypothetical protein ACFCD0_04175 [Gemmataceae bacterium]